MRLQTSIFLILAGILLQPVTSFSETPAGQLIRFDFCGQPVELSLDSSMIQPLGEERDLSSVQAFCNRLQLSEHRAFAIQLVSYREKYKMDDWLFYQLVRRTAQLISPKAEDYYRYTLYKWFFLYLGGYNPALRLSKDKILFYVQCDENIYNIPFYLKQGRQFVCLNYHDYGNNIAFDHESFTEIREPKSDEYRSFSYRVTHLPDFTPSDYQEKEIAFNYHEQHYQFKIKLNPQIKTIFINYPSVDYSSILNIPLSRETYETLIPKLKKVLHGLKTKDGVDYLMHFTRHAFMFETDQQNFGNEKRLTPEQTLLYDQSDCEDRVALFYFLVKEIYDLPMIVLSYPGHVTLAVKFDKPVGKPVIYNGEAYTLCEPTPQETDLPIGQLMPSLRKLPYEIVYAYSPPRE